MFSWIYLICCLFFIHTASSLKCYCEGEGCAEHHINSTCLAGKDAKCYATIREVPDKRTEEVHVVYEYGCLPAEENTILQCRGNLPPQVFYRFRIECCGHEDFCNDGMVPELPPRVITTPEPNTLPFDALKVDWRYVGAALAIVLGVSVAISIYCCFRCRSSDKKTTNFMEKQNLLNAFGRIGTGSDLEKGDSGIDHSMSSGSGSGIPRLTQTHIARQLHMIKNVGKGRYGEVWHGNFKDEDVAVKIFCSLDQASFESERELYDTKFFHHPYILGYKASDIGGEGGMTQMLLVTDYHDRGSLYDFLRNLTRPLYPDEMHKMAHSIAAGLAFLHGEIVGNGEPKPLIAHRDIKSKNILVRHDGQCVIADFGLAVRKDVRKDLMLSSEKRQGTRRYMAPEILIHSIKKHEFEAFLQADMYSFGLVLWELARCTDAPVQYQLPYYEYPEVGVDPDFDTMISVVCRQNLRPTIPAHWFNTELMVMIQQLMQECWHRQPSARLTALNVKKKLSRSMALAATVDNGFLSRH